MLALIFCDSGWGLIAGAARDWFARSPRRLILRSATGGLMMVSIGTATLFVANERE